MFNWVSQLETGEILFLGVVFMIVFSFFVFTPRGRKMLPGFLWVLRLLLSIFLSGRGGGGFGGGKSGGGGSSSKF